VVEAEAARAAFGAPESAPATSAAGRGGS